MSHHYKGSYVRLATVLSLGNLISHASPQQGSLQWNGAAQAFTGLEHPANGFAHQSIARHYPLLAPRAEQQDAPVGQQQMGRSEEHAGAGNELLARASELLRANRERLNRDAEDQAMYRHPTWYNAYVDQQKREIDVQQSTIIKKSIIPALGVGASLHVLGRFSDFMVKMLRSEDKCPKCQKLPAQHLSCNDKVAAVEVMIIPCLIAGMGLNMLRNYWQRYKALEQRKKDEQSLLPIPLSAEDRMCAQLQNATLQALITDGARITDIASLKRSLEGVDRDSVAWAREITERNHGLLLGSECSALVQEIMRRNRGQVPPAAPPVDRAS